MGLMPAYMENDGILSTKVVCFYQRKPGSTLPGVQSTVLLLDPEYGNVKAVSEQLMLDLLHICMNLCNKKKTKNIRLNILLYRS